MSTERTENLSKYNKVAPVLPRITAPLGTSVKDVETQSGDNVDYQCEAYREMMGRWELILHLKGGTPAMRQAGRKYLPQEPKETDQRYLVRLSRTFLYGVYARIVKVLSALPFTDYVVVKNAPPELDYLRKTCTDDKRSIEEFGRESLMDGIDFGIAHFLVDKPVIPPGLNLKQEQDLDAKPYFAQISPTSIINWDFEDGKLTMLCIYSYSTGKKGSFGEEEIHTIAVWKPDSVTLWESRGGSWEAQPPRENPLGYIPLVTYYCNKDGGPMRGAPVLEELAWMNLRHYQKMSDLDNIEHVANVPFLFGSGFGEDEVSDIEVGTSAMVTSTSTDAKIIYVEHSGQAIPSSQKGLDNIEKRMEVMGSSSLVSNHTSRQTAFSKAVDTGQSMSIMATCVNNLGDALERGYKIAADWLNISSPDVDIVVGEGIDLSLGANDFTELKALADDEYIEITDFENELKRRGKLSDSVKLKKPSRKTGNTDNSGDPLQTKKEALNGPESSN